jgi:hypothetical protein
MGNSSLVFPESQFFHSLAKFCFLLNALNPICIDVHPLNALLQGSRNGRLRAACKELLYLLGLLK